MTLLHGGTVWISDRWEVTDILLDGHTIAAVGPDAGAHAPEKSGETELIDCGGKLIVPGLINSHSHSYTGLLRGTVDAMPLDIYMLFAIAGGTQRSEQALRVSTQIDAIQMIRSGITSAVDHFSQRPSQELGGLRVASEAYLSVGLRARIAPMFSDKGFLDTIPLKSGEMPDELRPAVAAKPQTVREFVSVCEQAAGTLSQGEMVRFTLGTDGPQRCTPELLEATADLEKRMEMGWHTHMLEAKSQSVVSHEAFGRSLIEHVDTYDLLNDRAVLVHAVWLSERDIEIAAERGIAVAHCPISNLHLGSGVAPVVSYRDAGISVGIGTDGGNMGALSVLENVRTAARLSRVAETDYTKWLTASDALQMCYGGGARIMGLPGRIGTIAPGALADLCVLSTAANHWYPPADLTSQLVYYESGASVESVFVNGTAVMRDGAMTTVDENSIYEEAAELGRELQQNNSERIELARAQAIHLRDMYDRAMRHDLGMSRLVNNKER